MIEWKEVLRLDQKMNKVSGSEKDLADAVRNAADLRFAVEFIHNEHVDPSSDSPELVREECEFAVSYLMRDEWVAGIMNLRQPTDLLHGFGMQPSMSFFIYNQNGQQAIGRPYLDGRQPTGKKGPSPAGESSMWKHEPQEAWDQDTNAPSHNFIWYFETYRCHVNDSWREVLAHDADGNVTSGSIDELADAFGRGCSVKVGINGLCSDLAEDPENAMEHEVFVHTGSNYYYTEQKIFIAGSHPVVRVRPATPLVYKTDAWDFGWLMVQTDGNVWYRRCDPYTLKSEDLHYNHGIRWFVR